VFADGAEDPRDAAGYPVTTLTEEDADALGVPEASVTFRHP
jgi:hypothetical protein